MMTEPDWDLLRAKAAQGDTCAMTQLGKHLIARGATAKDALDGQTFLQQALEGNDAEAAEFIAVLMASGMTGAQNWDMALDYLVHAARLGSVSAFRQVCILAGRDPDISVFEAQAWDAPAFRASIHIAQLLSLPERVSLSEVPAVRYVDGFLPPRMCEWLIARARPLLQRAHIYDSEGSAGLETQARTNSSANFDLLGLDMIILLTQSRIAAMTNAPLFAMETPMVLHYNVGEEFAAHHDYLDPHKPAQAEDMRKFGQRLATFLVYLNDDFDGGETEFCELGFSHKCPRGGALFFGNVDAAGQPNPRTLHAGKAPTQGEKWLLSQWIRSGPQSATP